MFENSEKIRLKKIANRLRIKVIQMIAISGTGHAGGSMSIAEIITVLYFHELKIYLQNLNDENRNRFILSKGHSSLILYAALSEIGFISENLLSTIHNVDSPLQMHPERGICPGIEISTGALGQGLSSGIGMAIGAKMKNKNFRVYVLLGDGEMCEGQVWEAILLAPKFKLDNLVAIVDYNKLSQSNRIVETIPFEPFYDKWTSFGWYAIEVNGHSVSQLINAFDKAKEIKEKPTVIIAHTVKGYGIPDLEDKIESHSVSFNRIQIKETLQYLGCSDEEINNTILQMKDK